MKRLMLTIAILGVGLVLTACQPMQTAPSVVPGVDAPSTGSAGTLQSQSILWGD